MHGSDSAESAEKELALFFTDAELVEYERSLDPWLVSDDDE